MIVIDSEGVPRRPGAGLRPALLLDRDGVVNVDRGWVGSVAAFDWIDGIFALLRAANAAGHAVVVVTNQGGIGRGFYSEADFRVLTDWMLARVRAEGARVDRVVACPHHPEAAEPSLRLVCECRKPGTRMIAASARDLGLDLAGSALIGDKASDMEAGRRAGVGRLVLHTAAGNGNGAPAAADDVRRVATLAAAQALLYG